MNWRLDEYSSLRGKTSWLLEAENISTSWPEKNLNVAKNFSFNRCRCWFFNFSVEKDSFQTDTDDDDNDDDNDDDDDSNADTNTVTDTHSFKSRRDDSVSSINRQNCRKVNRWSGEITGGKIASSRLSFSKWEKEYFWFTSVEKTSSELVRLVQPYLLLVLMLPVST